MSGVVAWLRRVSLNLTFNRLRDVNGWRLRAQKADIGRQPTDPADEIVRRHDIEQVRAVLADLPTKQRDCLLLPHAGYSYTEIAATLEIAAGSVRTTLPRGERDFKTSYTQILKNDK